MDSATLQQLLHPPAATEPGELRETHISWVILRGEFVYKIKKPVNFDFLDFSSLAQRRHFCEEEVRLNRRFAPELYLSVVPVTSGAQGPQLEGEGEIIDYAVKMRRFDERQLLDNIAARDGLSPALLRSLARELARLHNTLPACRPDPAGSEPGTPAALRAAIQQNFQQIRDYPLSAAEADTLAGVEQWTLQRYDGLLPLLRQRVLDGRVIDGHGDAHLGNITLVDGAVRLFDCIEFNASLRIMDSMAEIAFLTMDLDAKGYHDASHCLLTDYLEYRDDVEGLALLDLYRSYFAMVRAKVNLLRESKQHPPSPAPMPGRRSNATCNWPGNTPGPGLFSWPSPAVFPAAANPPLRAGWWRPAVRCACAPMWSANAWWDWLRNSAASPRMQPHCIPRQCIARPLPGWRRWRPQQLEAGFAVIVDATFLHREVRDTFRALARRLAVPFVIIDCEVAPAELRRRLVERERLQQDASEADVAVMEQQLAIDQPLSGEELACRLQADSAEDQADLWQRFQQQLDGRGSAVQ